jgi:hypothetical protein
MSVSNPLQYYEDKNLTLDLEKLLCIESGSIIVSKGGLRADLVSFQKQDPDLQPSYGQGRATKKANNVLQDKRKNLLIQIKE